MALVFHRGLAIPLWAVAFFAVALTASPRPMPPVSVVLVIAVIALTMMAMIQWRRTSRALVEVRPAGWYRGHAGIIMTTMKARRYFPTVDRATSAPSPAAALDLVRMDDDGAWQTSRETAFPVTLIPGAREPGMLTTNGTSAANPQIADGLGIMAAATVAERQREGGGAPNQRRPLASQE